MRSCTRPWLMQSPTANSAGDRLKVVSTMSAGYNHVDIDECKKNSISVGFTPDVLTDTTADLAVALVLSAARRVVESAAAVKAGEWTSWKPMWMTGKDVHHSKVGIIGLGSIGAAIARRMTGFGCSIQYTGGSGPKPAVAEPLGAEYMELDALLASSDFVILACALTPQTKHLIDAAALSKMKRDAVLVNIARGDVVQQDALVQALKEGTILAAGLDVTTPEPLPTDHPLLALPNCVVLPHIGSASVPTRELIANMAADNILAGLQSKPLPFPVPGTSA